MGPIQFIGKALGTAGNMLDTVNDVTKSIRLSTKELGAVMVRTSKQVNEDSKVRANLADIKRDAKVERAKRKAEAHKERFERKLAAGETRLAPVQEAHQEPCTQTTTLTAVEDY